MSCERGPTLLTRAPRAALGVTAAALLVGVGGSRARSHRRFAPPLIRFIPDPLTYSAPLFLKRQCDRTPGGMRALYAQLAGPTHAGEGGPEGVSPTSLECLVSKSVNSDTRPRPTTGGEVGARDGPVSFEELEGPLLDAVYTEVAGRTGPAGEAAGPGPGQQLHPGE